MAHMKQVLLGAVLAALAANMVLASEPSGDQDRKASGYSLSVKSIDAGGTLVSVRAGEMSVKIETPMGEMVIERGGEFTLRLKENIKNVRVSESGGRVQIAVETASKASRSYAKSAPPSKPIALGPITEATSVVVKDGLVRLAADEPPYAAKK